MVRLEPHQGSILKTRTGFKQGVPKHIQRESHAMSKLIVNHLGKQVVTVVNVACVMIAAQTGRSGRYGGVVRVLVSKPGKGSGLVTELITKKIGTILDPGKEEKYRRLATEKAGRLLKHPEHLTSFSSKNDALEQYQGAIRAGDFILSFSGLPSQWDEACMIVLARLNDLIDTDDWKKIIAESNNLVAQTLWETVTEADPF